MGNFFFRPSIDAIAIDGFLSNLYAIVYAVFVLKTDNGNILYSFKRISIIGLASFSIAFLGIAILLFNAYKHMHFDVGLLPIKSVNSLIVLVYTSIIIALLYTVVIFLFIRKIDGRQRFTQPSSETTILVLNSTNIGGYINFLHLKKYNFPAPQELITEWSRLSDEEILSNLKGLYYHWNIKQEVYSKHEKDFFSFDNNVRHESSNFNKKASKSYRGLLSVIFTIFFILVLAMIIEYGFHSSSSYESTSTSVIDSPIYAPTPMETSPIEIDTTRKTEIDTLRK